MSVFARKSFNGKFTVEIDFPIGRFVLPLLTLTLESKVSSYITDKHLEYMLVIFEQNHMIGSIQTFELVGEECLTIFETVMTQFWKQFL